jgi:hypothetical protein
MYQRNACRIVACAAGFAGMSTPSSMNRSGSAVFRRRERRACEGVRIGEGSHSRRTTMRHLVLVSISSFCVALVASVGLAAYTAAHPEAGGVVTKSSPEGRAPYHKIVG